MRLLSIIVFTVVLISNTFGQTTPTTQVKTIADLVALRIPTINNRLSALVTGRVTENDGGGGLFFYDGSDATSTNLGTVFKPAASNGRWRRSYEGALNVKWFGALGNGSTDDTLAFQNALDLLTSGGRLEVPPTSTSYRVSQVIIKYSGTQLVGIGGGQLSRLLYSKSTGADAEAVLLIDKTAYNSGNNYKDIVIENIELDGNNNALYALKTHGFTRRCKVVNSALTAAVCLMYATDNYYSTYQTVEFSLTPGSPPSGMNAGVYASNLYGVYMDTCNSTGFYNCQFETVGASSFANTYLAILSILKGENITFEGTSIENSDVGTFGRYHNTAIRAASATLYVKDLYMENVDSQVQTFLSWDTGATEAESLWIMDNVYMSGIGAPILISSSQTQGLWDLRNVYADGLDISDRVFAFDGTPIASQMNNVKLSNCIFSAGFYNGTFYDASTMTNSFEGLVSQPIVLNNNQGSGPTGFVKSGYAVSLGATYVEISGGEIILNGQSLLNTRAFNNARGPIRLYPDLTGAAKSWNVKVSTFGAPYVEDQASPKTGSTFCPTIATFTTPGGGGAPAGLAAVAFNGAIPVAGGGTGAVTLTGIVYGNGTSAMTAGTVSTAYLAKGKASSPGLENSSVIESSTTINVGGSDTVPWRNNYAAVQIGGNFAIGSERTAGGSNGAYILQNGYIDPTANTYYAVSNGGASAYLMFGGEHLWRVQSSATAGAAIGFTNAVGIDNTGNLVLKVAGKGLQIKEGSNARMGTATLVGGTIAVANTSVTANTRVFISRSTTGGTVGHLSTTQIASTSFTVNSSDAGDTSTVNWLLIEPSP
jgi:hypothetical protein